MDKILVDKLFVGPKYKTQVWATKNVQDSLDDLIRGGKRSSLFVRKLAEYAVGGFDNYIGIHKPIRPEGKGVYRIGIHGQLFRVIGFFSSTKYSEFIAVEAFHKHATKLRSYEQNMIDGVAHLKKCNLWEYGN